MQINFNTDKTFEEGILRLSSVLDFEICEGGIPLNAVCGDRIGASLKDGKGTIYYSAPHHFFRELGVFVENARKKSEFDITEDGFFKTMGVMLDSSRGAVPTVSTLYKAIDYLALMGYNMVMLYTEDTIELKTRPYFGYLRGRYTDEELRAIDDYAFAYGIEVIPCLECYGHMGKYLVWDEAFEIRDTANVLLAREEKTFKFLDELISHTSSLFRSNRIHIGMDEAWDMGRGAFLTKNGYVPPIDIFNEYMTRLIEITNKYNLIPMMWSDMYFRVNSPNNAYMDESINIPESTKKIIPKEVQLVFWHYGEEPYCDDYMLKKHIDLGRDVLFAGGLWSWIGHFPEHNYAFETTKFSLNACRNNNVNEMISTVWLNDGSECDLFATLYGLSFSAELCYNKDASDEDLSNRFNACTGGNAEAFYTMSMYHNKFDENEKYENFHDRFIGKPLFWQDVMAGLFESHLYDRPLSGHYKTYAEKMKQFKGGRWDYLYNFATLVFEYLALKSEIAEKGAPSYKKGDSETLTYISETLLPALLEKTKQVHEAHKKMWFESYKALGWSVLDIRYAGVEARCKTAKELIDNYLCGKADVIEEYEDERLYKPLGGFITYKAIAYVG